MTSFLFFFKLLIDCKAFLLNKLALFCDLCLDIVFFFFTKLIFMCILYCIV